MAAPHTGTAGVIILTVLLLSSEAHDVQRGSDITSCSMKCPNEKAALSLYKVCGDNETHLAKLSCDTMSSIIGDEPRFYLDASSGCWTLRDAREEDSCVYRTVDHNSTINDTNLTISVIESDVLTGDITPGNSTAPSDPRPSRILYGSGVLFPLLIFLIVLLVMCYMQRKKPKNLESDGGSNDSEEDGRLNSSSPDADNGKLWLKIRRLCRNSTYEETQQREMEEGRPDATPEDAQN